MNRERWRALAGAWWIAVPFALSAAVSYPITRNYFFGDDLLSVYDVINKPFVELLLVPYGGHLYVVRNALFALLFWCFGPDPHAYYWVALLTHLANVVLLCALLRALTGSARLACLGGALWGTAPVTEGTIGWYSVYGHALATTALLLILLGIVRAGRRGAVSNTELGLWAVLVFAAGTSFGVGLAFAVVLPVIAWLLLPRGAVRRRAVGLLGVMAVTMPLAYFIARQVAVARYGSDVYAPELDDWLGTSIGVADLVATMLAYGTEQIVLGPLARFVPGLAWPAVLAAPVWLGVGLAFATAQWTVRRAMLAFAMLPAATYAVIAIGRFSLYPYLKQLLVLAPRYHYAAPLAVTVLVCLALAQLDARHPPGPRKRNAALALWLVGLATGLAFVRAPFQHFNWARRRADAALASLQRLIDSAPPGEDVYIENQLFLGVGPLVQAVPSNFPGWAGLFVVYYPNNVVHGNRVLFVEPDADVRAAAARGVRSATLLVAPDTVPPGHLRRAPPPHPGPAPPPQRPAAPPIDD